ncbi:hypothetical protein COEREDRAFT_88605 [Coemansia reversa NRRL 1564]|uniref:Uncharacterized protein n=1 Tax=Coemansia reversa (strain ATCC 12441 / NRRL 1564) TaxID=763665 RepID=A0A2G5B6L6_COERN|nr:hypothetical protein COEREDRAFT_88605 [Coemansia reversa NRRL 1564]|eukprot:PIA14634.1 hypothetical protein COEREDRAFT_88605 [Coemansia reversa NRRL 1564]
MQANYLLEAELVIVCSANFKDDLSYFVKDKKNSLERANQGETAENQLKYIAISADSTISIPRETIPKFSTHELNPEYRNPYPTVICYGIPSKLQEAMVIRNPKDFLMALCYAGAFIYNEDGSLAFNESNQQNNLCTPIRNEENSDTNISNPSIKKDDSPCREPIPLYNPGEILKRDDGFLNLDEYISACACVIESISNLIVKFDIAKIKEGLENINQMFKEFKQECEAQVQSQNEERDKRAVA